MPSTDFNTCGPNEKDLRCCYRAKRITYRGKVVQRGDTSEEGLLQPVQQPPTPASVAA